MYYPYYNIKLYDKMSVYPNGNFPGVTISKMYQRDFHRGRKIYEIKDFQGSPRLMFSDLRSTVSGVDVLDLQSVQNYYPYGMEMPFRTWAAGAIRYGYQGMDKDTTFSAYDAFYTTMFRGYDARLGR